MVLEGSKKFVPKDELKPYKASNFPECSVKVLYEEYKEHPRMMPYLPPKMPKGRTIDRTYFFNIMNTFTGEELHAIMKHALSLRNSENEIQEKKETIKLS